MLGISPSFIINSPLISAVVLLAAGALLIAYKQRDKLQKRLFTDTLTNVFTRLKYDLQITIEQKKLDSGKSKGVLIINIDLNKFKNINDTLGHAGGDAALQAVATQLQRKLKESCKKTDFVARLGGDEFVVIMTDINEGDGQRRANDFEQMLRQVTFTHAGNDYIISASVGSTHAKKGDLITTKMLLADAEMYAAKAQRKAGALVR